MAACSSQEMFCKFVSVDEGFENHPYSSLAVACVRISVVIISRVGILQASSSQGEAEQAMDHPSYFRRVRLASVLKPPRISVALAGSKSCRR